MQWLVGRGWAGLGGLGGVVCSAPRRSVGGAAVVWFGWGCPLRLRLLHFRRQADPVPPVDSVDPAGAAGVGRGGCLAVCVAASLSGDAVRDEFLSAAHHGGLRVGPGSSGGVRDA